MQEVEKQKQDDDSASDNPPLVFLPSFTLAFSLWSADLLAGVCVFRYFSHYPPLPGL
jgi:hypothetical protein